MQKEGKSMQTEQKPKTTKIRQDKTPLEKIDFNDLY
jgi:hypothetical protein